MLFFNIDLYMFDKINLLTICFINRIFFKPVWIEYATISSIGGGTIRLIYLRETGWQLDHQPPIRSLYVCYEFANLWDDPLNKL